MSLILCSKVKKKLNIRNQYKQVPYLTWDSIWESDHTKENITHKRTLFSAREHKAALNKVIGLTIYRTLIVGREYSLETNKRV